MFLDHMGERIGPQQHAIGSICRDLQPLTAFEAVCARFLRGNYHGRVIKIPDQFIEIIRYLCWIDMILPGKGIARDTFFKPPESKPRQSPVAGEFSSPRHSEFLCYF